MALRAREAVMKQVPARFDTVDIGFHDATLVPVVTVESGDEIFIKASCSHVICSRSFKVDFFKGMPART